MDDVRTRPSDDAAAPRHHAMGGRPAMALVAIVAVASLCLVLLASTADRNVASQVGLRHGGAHGRAGIFVGGPLRACGDSARSGEATPRTPERRP